MASARASSFAEARKRSARGKAMEVIDVEPLASIDPPEKGEGPSLKRKMEFEMPLEGKLMGEAMKITRTSRRLAGMKPPAPGRGGDMGGSSGGQKPQKVEEDGRKEATYVPCWNVNKQSRLISMEEKNEWAENLLPPGARVKFESYRGEELGSRLDHAIYENVGLLSRVKTEMEMRRVMMEKLKQELSKAQHAQASSAEHARRLEVEKIALELEKEVLEKEKEELKKQVQTAGSLGMGGLSVAQWKETAEFWSRVGAKIMVRNALCSPELKDWLLSLTAKCTDIGYTEGVTAVYTANKQKEKAVEFPFYEEGDTDGPKFIDGQIAELQNGIIDFEFLHFIEANPSLSSQELLNVFEQVYPEVEQQGDVPTEEVPSGAAENMPSEGGKEDGKVGTSEQAASEKPERDAEAEEIASVMRELTEDLGNAKED